MTTLDSLVARADLLSADCARIASEIERLAREVEDARRAPQDYAQQLKDLKANIDMAEVTIQSEVNTETVDAISSALKNKNDAQRKSAFQARVLKDPELIHWNREKRIIEQQKANADMKLDGAEATLKAYTFVQALKNSEAMLIAATMCALAPDAPSPRTIDTLEATLADRLSLSLREGKMKQIIEAKIAELLRAERERGTP